MIKIKKPSLTDWIFDDHSDQINSIMKKGTKTYFEYVDLLVSYDVRYKKLNVVEAHDLEAILKIDVFKCFEKTVVENQDDLYELEIFEKQLKSLNSKLQKKMKELRNEGQGKQDEKTS